MNHAMKYEAFKLAKKTADAYSRDSYSSPGWGRCAEILLEVGLSTEEAEEVLRSKVMRWAGDGSSNRYGYYTSMDMVRFFTDKSNIAKESREMFDIWGKD